MLLDVKDSSDCDTVDFGGCTADVIGGANNGFGVGSCSDELVVEEVVLRLLRVALTSAVQDFWSTDCFQLTVLPLHVRR